MRLSILPFLLMSSLAACTADGVKTEIEGDPDAGMIVDGDVPLEVDLPGATTYWSSMPMTGHGPPGGTLVFTTPGNGLFTTKLGTTGDFCVDVILSKNSVNTIKFEAISAEGTYSHPVLVDVTQEGDPPDDGGDNTPKPGYSNIAAGADILSMSVSVAEGDVSALVDGDTSGAVHLLNAATTADWLVIELNERLPIEQIRIKTTADCPLESFNILLSDSPDSGVPMEFSWGSYVYTDGWIMVASVEDATSAEQAIKPIVSEPTASRMAIEFNSSDCGNLIGRGLHKITEIEVWGRGTETPKPPTGSGAPSCTGL